MGRLTSVTDALSQVTSYTYDEVGNRLTQTDANGHTTSFEYDRLGRQVARAFPDAGPGNDRETMVYNADGTLASHTDFAGQTRTFGYDVNSRLTSRSYPDGSEDRFTYTATGQRETAVDARGVTSYAYDDRDRLLEKTDPTGHRLSYAYDLQGNLTSLTARFGPAPESAEQLAADAAKAKGAGFPHGVSTILRRRISGTDLTHRSALKSTVEKFFPVRQTGRNPKHHTVILPKPVTDGTAALFNSVFTVGR